MKNIYFLILLLGMVLVISCKEAENPSLKPTLYYSHSVEAPDTIYKFLKTRINSDTICSKYYNRAVLLEFELNDGVISKVEENIFEFDSKGYLICHIVNQSNEISKLILGLNIKPFNFSDDNNGYFGLVIDGNKLFN